MLVVLHVLTCTHLLPQREYVYNKPIVVKGADGREMHRTFKLKTPHRETVSRSPKHTTTQLHNSPCSKLTMSSFSSRFSALRVY